jgi:hypothetical protein
MIGCLENTGLLRMQLEVLLTCLDVQSQKLPRWTGANHEIHQLRVCGLCGEVRTLGLPNTKLHCCPSYFCYIYFVTLWGSSVSVVTTPHVIRALFPAGTRIFLVSTESIPALGPCRGVELTTLASIAWVKNAWMHTSIIAHSISLCCA